MAHRVMLRTKVETAKSRKKSPGEKATEATSRQTNFFLWGEGQKAKQRLLERNSPTPKALGCSGQKPFGL